MQSLRHRRTVGLVLPFLVLWSLIVTLKYTSTRLFPSRFDAPTITLPLQIAKSLNNDISAQRQFILDRFRNDDESVWKRRNRTWIRQFVRWVNMTAMPLAPLPSPPVVILGSAGTGTYPLIMIDDCGRNARIL
jgi:hypothetical protein